MADATSDCNVVVGLGNPGAKYDGTRHNIGFAAVDLLLQLSKDSRVLNQPKISWSDLRSYAHSNAARALAGDFDQVGWSQSRDLFQATVRIGSHELILLKPRTFMNLSGQPVSQVISYRKIPLSRVIVLHDEIDIPVSSLRVKIGGGEGGHNGLRSIASECGGKEFARVRIGVGKPPPNSPAFQGEEGIARWVLSRYTSDELPYIEESLSRTAAAVVSFIQRGLAATQAEFNLKIESKAGS